MSSLTTILNHKPSFGLAHMTRKILIVETGADYFASHRLSLAGELQKAGYDVHVTALKPGFEEKVRAQGFTFHQVANPEKGIWSLVRSFRDLLGQLNPDIVHFITLRSILLGGMLNLIGPRIAALHSVTGLGYLFTNQELKVRIIRRLLGLPIRSILNMKNTQVIFQNADDQTLFESRNWVRSGNHVLIRGSGVDPEHYIMTQPNNNPPVILFPSRLLKPKGIMEFVEAAKIVKDQGIQARFAVVGRLDVNNPEVVDPTIIDAWKEEKVVEFWGHRTDMVKTFGSVDIVCMPSYYREGVPKVLIEAASCGKPIIAADSPGCREIVEHEKNGLLVPPRSGADVARAMKLLLENTALLEQYGRAGRELVKKEFSLESVNLRILACYQTLETSDES